MRPLLIFDLNGVFVSRDRDNAHKTPDFIVNNFNCYIRPGTRKFLKWVHYHFDVAVWSSTMRHNTIPIIKNIWGKNMKHLKFIFTQEQCTYNGKIDKKPIFLKKLVYVWEMFPWANYNNTLLIDDSIYKCANNPEYTSIHPETFNHNVKRDTDNINANLKPYLIKLLNSKISIPEFVCQTTFG